MPCRLTSFQSPAEIPVRLLPLEAPQPACPCRIRSLDRRCGIVWPRDTGGSGRDGPTSAGSGQPFALSRLGQFFNRQRTHYTLFPSIPLITGESFFPVPEGESTGDRRPLLDTGIWFRSCSSTYRAKPQAVRPAHGVHRLIGYGVLSQCLAQVQHVALVYGERGVVLGAAQRLPRGYVEGGEVLLLYYDAERPQEALQAPPTDGQLATSRLALTHTPLSVRMRKTRPFGEAAMVLFAGDTGSSIP